jgi:hypothetical protein
LAGIGYKIVVQASNEAEAAQGARELADELREIDGVLGSQREKQAFAAMDLGSIVQVVISSGAAVAIAQGIADWIRRTRGVHLVIERGPNSDSLKVDISNIDPEAAVRISEIVSGN